MIYIHIQCEHKSTFIETSMWYIITLHQTLLIHMYPQMYVHPNMLNQLIHTHMYMCKYMYISMFMAYRYVCVKRRGK